MRKTTNNMNTGTHPQESNIYELTPEQVEVKRGYRLLLHGEIVQAKDEYYYRGGTNYKSRWTPTAEAGNRQGIDGSKGPRRTKRPLPVAPDPYKELKEALAQGKTIQYNSNPSTSEFWYDAGRGSMALEWGSPVECYRIKSELAPSVEDPHKELKAAYNAGKTIQNIDSVGGTWHDMDWEPSWSCKPEDYRIKPEDPYAELKEAYKAGKTIQGKSYFTPSGWEDLSGPLWCDPVGCYRIKPEAPTEDRKALGRIMQDYIKLQRKYDDVLAERDDLKLKFQLMTNCKEGLDQALQATTEQRNKLVESIKAIRNQAAEDWEKHQSAQITTAHTVCKQADWALRRVGL